MAAQSTLVWIYVNALKNNGYLLIRHFRDKKGTGAEMHPATLFTIPTIFARAQGLMGLRQCHGVSQGADKRKILPREEIAVEFIVLDNN